MTWTDEELVARSIGGDADSFNELILRWERPIYALAYRTIGREEDARDVCQETFLRAFRALPGFRGQAKFSSWLYRIALNLCRDWMRRERRTPVVQAPEDVDLMELAAAAEPSESIEDLVARKDLSRLVERAMALLPEEQRTAIVLKEYHGLTFQEIADLVGCPLSTVKTRLYQGLTVLRRELAKNSRGHAVTEAYDRDVLHISATIATKRSSRISTTRSTQPGAARAFEAHLPTCARCRAELAELRGVRGAARPVGAAGAELRIAFSRGANSCDMAAISALVACRFRSGRRSRPRCCSSACPPASRTSTCATTRPA